MEIFEPTSSLYNNFEFSLILIPLLFIVIYVLEKSKRIDRNRRITIQMVVFFGLTISIGTCFYSYISYQKYKQVQIDEHSITGYFGRLDKKSIKYAKLIKNNGQTLFIPNPSNTTKTLVIYTYDGRQFSFPQSIYKEVNRMYISLKRMKNKE